MVPDGCGWVIFDFIRIYFVDDYDRGYTEFLRKKLLFQLGYYRTASDANSIVLADGRREMADSEFGTGTNAEKVNISLLFDTGCSNLYYDFHWNECFNFS